MKRTVAVIGTFDTKGSELRFIKEQIETYGVSTILIDVSTSGKIMSSVDITAEQVLKAGGLDLGVLQTLDRGGCVKTMGKCAAQLVKSLCLEGSIHAAISGGGGGGTSMGSAVMQALPIGFPKLLVSTLASGNTRQYIGMKDIIMMNSIVDFAGLNYILRNVLANAAAAIAGMAKKTKLTADENKPILVASMFGVTTPCVTKAQRILEQKGYEVITYHATGIGGMAMESFIASGLVKGVMDITTTEIADELVGGVQSAGANRLEISGEMGIPQVIAPGALDMVNFLMKETVPPKFDDRLFHIHNPQTTLMRTTIEENKKIGKSIAEKLNKAKGLVTFVWPKKGVSAIDKEGQPFFDREADEAFIETLKKNISNKIKLVEVDAHINDDIFAEEIANQMLISLEERG